MDLYAGGEFSPPLHLSASPRQLARRRRRCAKLAKLMLAAVAVGAAALCVVGLRPVAVAIPLFLGTVSLLLGAASAALFARVAQLELGDCGPDSDDDDRGFGGGWDEPGDLPGGSSPRVDWQRFERDFHSYCAQVGSRQG